MRVAILSDIHGNLAALTAVLEQIRKMDINGFILLGDLIDYGPHSNEVVEIISALGKDYAIYADLWGNHEDAIVNQSYGRFSSNRGKQSAAYTASILKKKTLNYICEQMDVKGYKSFICDGKRCMAVHGSMEDPYWGNVSASSDVMLYREYDCVFSGHTHIPHYFTRWVEVVAPDRRNRKPILFINPGSVGQPRNQNPLAQFAIWDTDCGEVSLMAAHYDIEGEQACFSEFVDIFYKERLSRGI